MPSFHTFYFQLLLTLLLPACALSSPTPPNSELPDDSLPEINPIPLAPGEKLSVVATTNIIADVVDNIAGDDISLTTIIAPGQDPHTYEPAPRAVAAIEAADIIFVNGFGFEEVLLETIENVASGFIVPVSSGIQPLSLSNQDHAEADPHVWVIPRNGVIWARTITAVLAAADPANSTAYHQRAADYIEQLNDIDYYVRSLVARIPRGARKLVTDHESLAYFAAEFEFEIIGSLIPSASTSTGASPADFAALVELIQRDEIPAIFISASAGQGVQRLAASLSEEVGIPMVVIPLLTGSLAPPGEPGDTYLDYLRYNIEQIMLGLLG